MKKLTFWKSLFLLCALIVGSSSAWGQVSTATATNGKSYVVAYYANNKYYALPHGTTSGTWDGTEVTLNSANKVNTSVASSLSWTLTEGSTSGQFYITYKSSNKTYYLTKSGTTGDNKNINVVQSSGNDHLWEFSLNSGNNNYTVKSLKSITSGTTGASLIYLGYGSVGKFGVYASSSAAKIILLEIGDVITHTLTYSATNGSISGVEYGTTTAVASGGSIIEGGKVTLTASPASGYKFKEWSVDGTGSALSSTSTNPTTFTMGTANATVTAVFEEDNTKYDINLNQTSDGTIEADKEQAQSGETVTLTPTPDDGYRLASWTVLDGDANEVTVTNNQFTMPPSDVDVEATFKQIRTITIDGSLENGSITKDKNDAIQGETVTLTITPDTDYELDELEVSYGSPSTAVSTTKVDATHYSFEMPDANVNVTAVFDVAKGTLTNPYTVAELADVDQNTIIYVTGYIIGSNNNNRLYKTGSSVTDANWFIMDTPNTSYTNGTNTYPTGSVGVELPSGILRKNYGLVSNSNMLGEKVLIKGTRKDYYGTKGVKSTTMVIYNNSATSLETIESTSDIPNYSADRNELYFIRSVNTNTITGAANVVKETDAGVCTAEEIKITDGLPLNIAKDITADKVTNSRTLSADADAYTWYEPYAYTLPDGNTAYTFTGANGSSLTFEEAGQTLAANTPYLIIAGSNVNGSINAETVVKATPAANVSGGEFNNWRFVGTYNSMTAAEAAAANMWALGSGNKWKYYTGTDTWGVYPRRCYMINSTEKASSARTFDTVFGGEATYIELVNKTNPEESRIYTLDGKYVGTKKDVLKSGVYVSNGKKFMVK